MFDTVRTEVGESIYQLMLNVWRLIQSQKTSLVYVQSQRDFLQVRGQEDWRRLLGLADADARADAEKRIGGETQAPPKNELPLFGPDLHSVLRSSTRGAS